VDALELQLALSNAYQIETALALYNGDFLADLSIHESRRFEHWLLTERERLRGMVVEGLQHLIDDYNGQANFVASLSLCARLLKIDPFREESHRQMMTLLANNGQQATALAHYHALCRTLLNERGAEPEAATVELYRSLQIV
jgi:DNA-binding SARP family transcriptional activator